MKCFEVLEDLQNTLGRIKYYYQVRQVRLVLVILNKVLGSSMGGEDSTFTKSRMDHRREDHN